jgi:hypothetical protein
VAALRLVENLKSVNEKQRQKIIAIRREQQTSPPPAPALKEPQSPKEKDMFSHKKADATESDDERTRIMKLKFAWYRHHLIMSSKLKMRVARAFDKWKNISLYEASRAEMRREYMKIQVQQSKIKAERGSIEKIVGDVHRVRMEKVCLLLLQDHKKKTHEAEIAALKAAQQKEKDALLTQLRMLYYQLQQLNDTESQAVDAAKSRGLAHAAKVDRVNQMLQGWLVGEEEAKK